MRHFKVLLILLSSPLGAMSFAQESDPAAEAESAFADAFDDFDAGFDEPTTAWPLSGFLEGGYGQRLDPDPRFSSRNTLSELRARFETDWSNQRLLVTVKGEALYDEYRNDLDLAVRELSLQLPGSESLDLKVGRQILTWGTGDLLFLNDLFPKSWVSFFAGRDDEYLKAPSDAVRATWYLEGVNLDVVWSPRFEPDEYLTGERFVFFSPAIGEVVAPRPPLSAMEPEGEVENGELAVRLFRTVGPTEYAAYLYRGFFKQPVGSTPSFEPNFPRLDVVGGSLRRPIAQGLLNAEFAFHDSREDPGGSNPLVPNDQWRLLIGYEFEARPRFNVAFQYYLERTLDYDALIDNTATPEFAPERSRHLLTNRLTYRGTRDRLTLSLFTFYSPSDRDHYLRPVATFRQSDEWSFSLGANLFGGERPHTFFGQLEDNSNAYLRVRFSY